MISEFPLFVFTMLGGLSAGMAVISALFTPVEKPRRPWLVPLVSIVLLGVGLLGVLFHLGRPQLFFLAMKNLSAGITQEAYCATVFGVLLLAQLILTWRKGVSPKALSWACALVGLVLMFIMGCAYVVNVGTPAWATWLTVPLFVLGDIAMGAALWGAMTRGAYELRGFAFVEAVVLALLAVVLVAEGVHFASVDQASVPFYVSAALAVVGAVASGVAAKKPTAWQPGTVLACALVAVCVARWFFYAASLV